MNGFQFTSFYLDRPIRPGRVYDIFMPETVQHEIAIFLIHGGGWRNGSRSAHYHTLMEEFNRRGYIVASTDYRLNVTPQQQLADCREAYMHFCGFLQSRGLPAKIAVHGGSAGAHLASLLACADPGECGDDFSCSEWIAPVCATLQACPYTFEKWDDIFPGIWGTMQSVVGASYEERPDLYRQLSLNHHLHAGNPDLFFIEAEYEHMFWPFQKLGLARDIDALGNKVAVKIYPNVEHGFIYSLEREQQRNAFDDIIRFIENQVINGCEFDNRGLKNGN